MNRRNSGLRTSSFSIYGELGVLSSRRKHVSTTEPNHPLREGTGHRAALYDIPTSLAAYVADPLSSIHARLSSLRPRVPSKVANYAGVPRPADFKHVDRRSTPADYVTPFAAGNIDFAAARPYAAAG